MRKQMVTTMYNYCIVIITVVKTFVKNVMRVRICGNLRITSVAIVFRLQNNGYSCKLHL